MERVRAERGPWPAIDTKLVPGRRLMATHELVIDWCGRPLLANAVHRMHPMAAKRKRTEWGDAAIIAARRAGLPNMLRASVKVTAVFRTKQSLPDADGLAPTVKGVLDGLVRGRFLPDDGPLHVRSVTTAVEVDPTVNTPTLVVALSPEED